MLKVTYDPAGIVTAITTLGGSRTSYGYDGNYNQTSVTDALGNVTGYQYDKTDRLTSMMDALGNSNKYTYDAAGQLLSYTDRRGYSAGYEYDGHGNMSVYTDPTGHVTRYSYDANNNLTGVEDAAGGKTYYEYDSMDRMTAYIDALGRTTIYTYDQAGNLTSLTDDAGRTETNIYDEAGRLTEYVKNSGKRIHYDYDKLNRLIEKSYKTAEGEEAEASVRYGYDADGNRVSMMDTTGTSSYETDALGRITSVTNGAGKKVTYTYDANGNITAIGYPDGTAVSYEYDANNNLTRVTDREGKIVSYRYDSNSQLKYTNRPESNTATYITYDEEGNITRLMNVCTACDQTLSSYEYTYNEMGYVTEEKAAEAVTIYCNGHLNGNGNNGNGNGNGNHGNTHPGNNSDGTKHDNCHHGKFGATKALSTEDCGCYTAAITTTSSYVYNANWEILSCTQKRKGCSDIKYCYKYDDAGNRIEAAKWTGNTRTDIVKYTYNDSNQIETSTTLEKKKWVTTTYEYDEDGNLVETIAGKAQIKNITAYEYDTENRLKAVTGGKDLLLAITYDGDGNRAFQLDYNPPAKGVGSRDTKIPEGISDAAAELYERITNNGGNASPNYCLTEYLNDVNTNYTRVLAEYGINFDSEVDYTYGMERISIETAGRKRDVYGNKLNSETSKCYYLYNGLGSVERVLDERQETDQFAYDPFGNLTLGYSDNVNSNSLVHRTGNMYTYNGEDYNRETGLQFLRARWYDTNRAVFLSEDSYLGDLLQPLTRNRYLYVCNNPLNFIDPSGHINWSRQLKYLTATVLGLAVGAAALAAFPATIAVGVGAAAVTFLMANAVMNKAEAMVQISSNSKKLAENRKTLENTTAKLNYIQNRFGTNEERMPSDVRAELCKLRSTMKTISKQNRMLCDSNAYYQKQDAAGNAQLQMALGTISLVLAPYAGPALAGGGTMAGMTSAALGTNAGIGLTIGGFDYNEAYTGKNPVKDFLGANTYEDVRTISNLVSGETVIAGASGVQEIEDARRADEIGNISQNAKLADNNTSIVNNKGISYPEIVDIRTGQNMIFPEDVDSRVPKDSRVGWYRNQSEAGLYRTNDTDILCKKDYIDEWYRRGYQTPEGGWDLYEIHHIKPREFGGSSDFENMVPLLKDIHRKDVTPWWNSYGQ